MQGIGISKEKAEQSNQFFMEGLEHAFTDNLEVLEDLRRKVKWIFWVTLTLYSIIFGLGVLLLSIPIVAAYSGDISIFSSVVGGTFGIVDIVALLLLKPVKSIHDLMGDMSQISMAINSYQQQVALRIVQFDSEDRRTIDLAADKIREATESSIKMIQQYVEGKEETGTTPPETGTTPPETGTTPPETGTTLPETVILHHK